MSRQAWPLCFMRPDRTLNRLLMPSTNVGNDPNELIYSGNADEYIQACRYVRHPHVATMRPSYLGSIERNVQDVQARMRILPIAAGLPAYLLSLVAKMIC